MDENEDAVAAFVKYVYDIGSTETRHILPKLLFGSCTWDEKVYKE